MKKIAALLALGTFALVGAGCEEFRFAKQEEKLLNADEVRMKMLREYTHGKLDDYVYRNETEFAQLIENAIKQRALEQTEEAVSKMVTESEEALKRRLNERVNEYFAELNSINRAKMKKALGTDFERLLDAEVDKVKKKLPEMVEKAISKRVEKVIDNIPYPGVFSVNLPKHFAREYKHMASKTFEGTVEKKMHNNTWGRTEGFYTKEYEPVKQKITAQALEYGRMKGYDAVVVLDGRELKVAVAQDEGCTAQPRGKCIPNSKLIGTYIVVVDFYKKK